MSARLSIEDFLEAVSGLIQEGETGSLVLVKGLAELAGMLVLLPRGCMMPPLVPSADSVANGLAKVLGAREEEANQTARFSTSIASLVGRLWTMRAILTP